MDNYDDVFGPEGIGGREEAVDESNRDFEPLPPGWYSVEIEKADLRDTRDGEGKRINVQMNVISEKFNGRKVFEGFEVINRSEKAVTISRKQLEALLFCAGVNHNIHSPDELLGLRFSVKLKIKPAKGGYPEDNAVAKYAPLGQAGEKSGSEKYSETNHPPAGPTSNADVVHEESKPTQSFVGSDKPAAGKMPWEQ